MQISKYVILCIIILCQLVRGSCQADSKDSLRYDNKPRSQKELDDYLEKKMKKAGLIGLQVAYISKDYIWQGNYGIKEYGTDQKVNKNTLFMIASCTKPITALGILKLVDNGKVKLDDPVNSYLPFQVVNPNFPKDEITIRMLLAHVSSIKDNWNMLTPLYTHETGGGDSPLLLADFMEGYLLEGGQFYHLKDNFLNSEVATVYQYSNVGYALLGYLIQRISGRSFIDFMREEIFTPLDMNDTYWMLKEVPHNNIAKPHELPSKTNKLSGPKIFDHYGYADYPSGQIRTTTSDYGRFLQLLLNNGVLNGKQFIAAELISEFNRVQYPEVNKYQAVSWNYNEFDNFIYYLLMPRLPSHTGADPGVATVVSFDPNNQIGAIIFTNSPPITFLDQKIFYQEIMKRLLREAKKYKQ